MSNVWDSLSASMQDFESTTLAHKSSLHFHPETHRQPNHLHHSRATQQSDDISQDSWSPPAWRKAGTGWFRPKDESPVLLPSPLLSDQRDDPNPVHAADGEEEEDVSSVAADIPLPVTPIDGRSLSPEVVNHRLLAHSDQANDPREQKSYIRFSVRADVQQRTEPIEETIRSCRRAFARVTKSPLSTITSILVAISSIFMLRALLQEPLAGPVPDLVKVAGLARSFEPLMYYSENGHSQVVQLGATGVAVWDLGESVRSSNMTSGPIIVQRLDELSESLKNLALELTRFFASIDGDIDSILIVMEWAQRELTRIKTISPSQFSSICANLHTVLSRVGVLEHPASGEQTAIGVAVQHIFGPTGPQVTRATLQRTFVEFLGVLEESISNELTASISLFAHFEAIDHQFLNLQRTVVRESDNQERQENEVLSSLWARVIGPNASRLRKFEKNKQLLGSLRNRTVENKHVLVDHNSRLLQLRSNLDVLRKKLVSPLVTAYNSSTLTIDEQIKGLEGTYSLLRDTREAQKTRLFNLIHDANAAPRRPAIHRNGEEYVAEDR